MVSEFEVLVTKIVKMLQVSFPFLFLQPLKVP